MRKTLSYLSIALCFVACSEDEDPKNVTSVDGLEAIRVPFGTVFSAIDFPDAVTVTYSDKTTESVAITFEQGSYDSNEEGEYEVEGTLTIPSDKVNTGNLKASVTVTVATLKLRAVSEDGVIRYQYYYDDNDRLDYFTVSNGTKYTYTYGADNEVTQRMRELAGDLYPEKYFYDGDGKLDRVEFYHGANVLGQTHTYTYTGSKISSYDNSDQSVAGLKFRAFEYTADDVSKVSFDVGNSWNFTYLTDKKVFTPLVLDLANPQNQVSHPVATFTYVSASTYTSVYEYNAQGYPTKETRTFPEDGNRQVVIMNTYQ